MERHADRLVRLNENLVRLGLKAWVQVRQGDAGAAEAARALGAFDRILLDAPCSNTGVLRRRPDARWRFSEARLRTMAARQRRLLTNLLPLLAPRGRLVYSTCSLESEENEELVEAVCRDLPAFACVDTCALLPSRDQTDGAFACAIERKTVESQPCSPG
jgi:16S rRNA (cytosine967-C5)-methyltransferase